MSGEPFYDEATLAAFAQEANGGVCALSFWPARSFYLKPGVDAA